MDATFYRFGPFRLFPSEQLLLREEEPVALPPKAFEVLRVLVANAGHLMTREALMQLVWPRGFVEEINLTVNVSLLRKHLGRLPDGSGYIVTVPKRGYRFRAPVTQEPVGADQGAALVPAQPETLDDAAIEPPAIVLPAPLPLVSLARQMPRGRSWFVAGLLLALTIAASIGTWRFALPPPAATSAVAEVRAPVQALAVLPFSLISDDPHDQYLRLGLADAVITRLGGLGTVRILPIGAVRRFVDNRDPAAAGGQLKVDAVLDGTIQRHAGQTRVNVRLTRVEGGRTLWTDSFDASGSAFALEDAISQRLLVALTPELGANERQRLASRPTQSTEAYDLYLRARAQLHGHSADSVRASRELFAQAIQADPNYAAAYAGLAEAYVLADAWGGVLPDPRQSAPQAKEAAERAVALDDASPEAHTSLAWLRLTWDWDWPGAEREFRRALDLDPANLDAHRWYAHELMALGRAEAAYAHSQAALELAPTDATAHAQMAWHLLFARRYAAAIAQARRALEFDPDYAPAQRVLGLAYLHAGGYDEACAEFQREAQRSTEDLTAVAYLARCHAAAHRVAQARAILARLERESAQRYVPASAIAAIHAALDEREAALHWLERACDEHASALIYLNVDPVFDPLRTEPRFAAIVARINLPRASTEALRADVQDSG